MGTNRTTWDTQDEIKFINNIGTWVPGRKSLNTKLELLENYFKTSKERNFSKNINKEEIIKHLKNLIEIEKKGMNRK